MAMPLDDILKAISSGTGPGAQIARGALKPTQVGGLGKFLSPTPGTGFAMPVGKLAGRGLVSSYTPPSAEGRRQGPGGAFGAALTALDFGRGVMTSTIKEGIDLLQGEGFDPREWWNQATTQYGFGELIHDERNWVGGLLMATSPFTGGLGLALGAGVLADNIWFDRTIGFIGDVAVDPLIYVGGFGAFARAAGWRGAGKQLGDYMGTLATRGLQASPKYKVAAKAVKAGANKRSLTATVKELTKTQVGREVAEHLGLRPGFRLRMPTTGPVGRQFPKVGGMGPKIMDLAGGVVGKPKWLLGKKVGMVPKQYRDMFKPGVLDDAVEAFMKGRNASRVATRKFEQTMTKVDAQILSRVAGQAARAPLEWAPKGLAGLTAAKGMARGGVGARFILQTADLPIKGGRAVTTERMRGKLAVLFDPEESIRKAFASDDAVYIQWAHGAADAARFARGRAKFFDRTIKAGQDKAQKAAAKARIADTSTRALERAIAASAHEMRPFAVRGDDLLGRRVGEIIDVRTDSLWYKNLPEDLRTLYQTDRNTFLAVARSVDSYGAGRDSVMFSVHGEDLGRVRFEKEGAPYSGNRVINPHFRPALFGEPAPVKVGKRGYKIKGRVEPGALKEPEYARGSQVPLDNPEVLPRVGEFKGYGPGQNKKGSLEYKEDGPVMMKEVGEGVNKRKVPVQVLYETPDRPFQFREPRTKGLAFDDQANRVTQRWFGMNMYEDRFSELSNAYRTRMEDDFRMNTYMERMSEFWPVAGPEQVRLAREAAEINIRWEDVAERRIALGKETAKVEDTRQTLHDRGVTAAAHAKNRDTDIGRWTAAAKEAAEDVAFLDQFLIEIRAQLRFMEDRLNVVGRSSEELNLLQDATAKLERRVTKVAKQRTIRGKMLTERDDIILESEQMARHREDLGQALDEILKLRETWEDLIRREIGAVDQRVARGLAGLEEDLQAARGVFAEQERLYAADVAAYKQYTTDQAEAAVSLKKSLEQVDVGTPEAERAATLATRLELEAARTAVPGIEGDSTVVAARQTLESSRRGLKAAEDHIVFLRERIAEVEAKPGFADEGSRGYKQAVRVLDENPETALGKNGRPLKGRLVYTQVWTQARWDAARVELADVVKTANKRREWLPADRRKVAAKMRKVLKARRAYEDAGGRVRVPQETAAARRAQTIGTVTRAEYFRGVEDVPQGSVAHRASTAAIDDAMRVKGLAQKRTDLQTKIVEMTRVGEEVPGMPKGMATLTGVPVKTKKWIAPGRLTAARQDVDEAYGALEAARADALSTGGSVTIVGPTDPRVMRPRLYAQNAAGDRGVIKIPQGRDELGPVYGLLRARRVNVMRREWEFTHLEIDLVRAEKGRNATLIRELRPGGTAREQRRTQGWRFFDEDVAEEGSTRITGQAAEARGAATRAERLVSEGEEGVAAAVRRMGGDGPPVPEPLERTFEGDALMSGRQRMTEAFDEGVTNLRAQLEYVKEQIKLVAASSQKFADEDETVKAMQAIVSALGRGAGGAEGLTASARVNRWLKLVDEFKDLDRILRHEQSTGVPQLEEVKTRLSLYNAEVERLGEEMGVRTQMEDIVNRVTGEAIPGLERRVPRVSGEELAELQGEYKFLEEMQAERGAFLNRLEVLVKKIAGAEGTVSKYEREQLNRLAKIGRLEAGAYANVLEQEVALFRERVPVARAYGDVQSRIEASLAKLEETRVRAGLPDEPFMVKATQKDVPASVKGEQELAVMMRQLTAGTEAYVEFTGRGKVSPGPYPGARGGYDADSSADAIFMLKKPERDAAQKYLKEALAHNEWGPWTLSTGGAYTREVGAVVDAFSKINNVEKWDGAEGLWQTWDQFQTYLKSAMIATPGFVNRNIFGAFFNAWLDDVNPAEIIRSWHMTRQVAQQARREGTDFYTTAKRMAQSDDRFKQYVELLEVGVRGGGQAVSSVELELGLRNARNLEMLIGRKDGMARLGTGRGSPWSMTWAPWSPQFFPYQSIRSVNSWVEDIVRLGVGMDTMRWGGSVDDAIARIAKSQFDYDELTNFERTWMRRFFPFYTWTRKNVPYQLNQLARNPAKYNKLLAAKRSLELGTEDEDIVPDYFLEPFGVRLPFSHKGATVYSAPDFPFQDLARYDPFRKGPKQTIQNVLSMLTPILKAPLETGMGKQIYSGVPFTGRYQLAPAAITSVVPGMKQALQGIGWIKQSADGTWKMRDHHIYIVTNMLPSLGVIRRLAPNEPKYQRSLLRSIMSTLGGMSVSFNTDVAKNNWLTNLRYERQEERQDWKDMISQTR